MSVDPDGSRTIPLISPWVDHHDRIESIVQRFTPAFRVERFDIERAGGQDSLGWWPAFGFDAEVDLSGRVVVLENAPFLALTRLRDRQGARFDEALARWVEAGGHLLIVGGPPGLESYAGTKFERLMGFVPETDRKRFVRRDRRRIDAAEASELFVDHLHDGKVTSARTLLEAGGRPFLIEQRVGRGRVTTLLSGAQGGLRADGGEPREEWFESRAWERLLADVVAAAYDERIVVGPEAPRPQAPRLARPDAFDIRYFLIGHQPFPFTYAPGEAYEHARMLRQLGFTSTVFGANPRRPLDDRRALGEIAAAALRIVYYDGVRRSSPRRRFWRQDDEPPRARGPDGKREGWDIHSNEFRGAAERLLDDREFVTGLPLRAVQLVEEFTDGGAVGPALARARRRRGLRAETRPGDGDWLAGEAVRSEETRATFQAFRAAGRRLFPGVPQSTYWPGSYWGRPLDYGYRLSVLGDAVDEIMVPGYGYGVPIRSKGPESVRWSANSGWGVLRISRSDQPHLAIYGMGRPLNRNGRTVPGLMAWRETAWTGLAHGATGLAYWALPRSEAITGLQPFHQEIERLGPWLAAPQRSAGRIALLQSWTSRSETGDAEAARALERCLKQTHEALEIAFEDVDVVLEEHLDHLSPETQALVVVGSPALSADAVEPLRRFLARGGHVFRDAASLVRVRPGNRAFDLARQAPRPERVHSLPLILRCTAARMSNRRAWDAWRALFREAGLAPRFETSALETGAALRGDAELVHVYGLNHDDEARVVRVELEDRWGGRDWIELRSGQRIRTVSGAPPILTSGAALPPGEAAVWASVARPAGRIIVETESSAESVRFRIRATDADGAAVAERYPIRFEASGGAGCADRLARSEVLRSGETTIEWAPSCSAAAVSAPSWMLTDAMTGRSWSSAEATAAAAQR